jgi:hypothetical protein
MLPNLRILSYNGSLVIWTVVSLTTAEFKPLIFSVWLHLFLCREHVHSHDFAWLLLVAGTTLLYNCIHTERWRLCASRGPVCTLENFQWCAKPWEVKVTLRLTVSQSVLVSSPIWGVWPGIYYCLTVIVLLLWGALSDERTDLSFVRVIVCSSKSFVIM